MIPRKSLFPLFAGLISLSALAMGGSVQAQVTYDPTFVQQLPTARLTTSGLQILTCVTSGLANFPTSMLGFTYTGNQLCNLLSNDPGFYLTTTPRFYRVNLCNPNPGQADYFVTGTLLILTGSRQGLTDNLIFPDTTPTQATVSMCNAPAAVFVPPLGFVPQATNSPVIAFNSVDLRGTSVPQDPNNPSFAGNGFAFGITRVDSTFPSLPVAYSLSGTGVNGTHYRMVDGGSPNPGAPALGNTGTLTVAAGSSPGGAVVFSFYDPNNHPERTVGITFTVPPGYQLIGPNTLTGRILELNNPALSLSPMNGQTTLTPGQVNRGFTITRTGGDQTQPLTVNYQVGGTAANGTDYGYLSGTATIPANQSSLNIPIVVPVPSGATPAQTVDITLTPNVVAYNFGASPTAPTQSFNIPAYNPSSVSVTPASSTTLVPGTTQAVGTITRSGGDTSQPLTVTLQPGGTAQQPNDYVLPGTVTIPSGQLSAPIQVTTAPQSGIIPQPARTLTITPVNGSGYTVPGGTAPITATIPAYNPSVVSVTPNGSGDLTPGTTQPALTVSRTGDTSRLLTIPLTVGGTAVPGTDYAPLPQSITIPAGQTSYPLPVTTLPQSGTTARPVATITVAATPPGATANYTVSGSGATLNIPAYTPTAIPAVTVSTPPGANGSTLTPGSSGSVTFTRTGDTSQSLPVFYTTSGTGQSGTDYSGLSGNATIPAGQSSVTIPIPVPSTATPGRTVAVQLVSGNGAYTPGTNSVVTYTVGTPQPAQAQPSDVQISINPAVPELVAVRTGGDMMRSLTVPLNISGGTAIPGVDYSSIPSSVTFSPNQGEVRVPIRLLDGATAGRTIQINLPAQPGFTPSYRALPGATTATFTIPNRTAVTPATPATITTTTATKKDDGKGGSALAPIAGVAGLGGIAVATGLFSSGGIAAVATGFAAVPQYCAQTSGSIDWQITPGTNGAISFSKPDVTFAKLGFAYTSGQVRVGDRTVAWGGENNPASPADALNLGNLDGIYNLQCLNLAQIEKASGTRLAGKPLGEIGLLRQTTLANLARTAFQRAKTIGEIPGMAEMLAGRLPQGINWTQAAIAKMSFAELLQQVPQLQQLSLGSMAIGQIPGFMQVPLANFPDWKNFAVSEVPGLADVPFGQFPSKPAEKTSRR